MIYIKIIKFNVKLNMVKYINKVKEVQSYQRYFTKFQFENMKYPLTSIKNIIKITQFQYNTRPYFSMEQPQQSYQKQNEQPQLAHSHNALKPFLGRCMSKHIPIGAQLHQAQIPPLLTIQTFNQNKEFVLNSIQQYQKRAQFKRSKVDIKKLQDYLLFVEDYFQEKDPESIPLDYSLNGILNSFQQTYLTE